MHNLDRRLTVVQRVQTGTSPLGTPIYEEQRHTISCAKRDTSTSERFAAGQVGAALTTMFVVRWNEFTRSIQPVDKFIFERRWYEIQGAPKETGGRRRFLEFDAAADYDAPLVEDES